MIVHGCRNAKVPLADAYKKYISAGLVFCSIGDVFLDLQVLLRGRGVCTCTTAVRDGHVACAGVGP